MELYYNQLNLKIVQYNTPKEFANSAYKPFGDIPNEYWEDCITFMVNTK